MRPHQSSLRPFWRERDSSTGARQHAIVGTRAWTETGGRCYPTCARSDAFGRERDSFTGARQHAFVCTRTWTKAGVRAAPPELAATPSGGSGTASLVLDNTPSCVRGPGPRREGVAAPPALAATPSGGSGTASLVLDNTPLCVRGPGSKFEGVAAPPAATLSGGNGTTPLGLVIRGLMGAGGEPARLCAARRVRAGSLASGGSTPPSQGTAVGRFSCRSVGTETTVTGWPSPADRWSTVH